MSIDRRKLLTLFGLGALLGPKAILSARDGGVVDNAVDWTATGGIVREPIGGASDNIIMMLSNGEYVIPSAKARQFIGRINSHRINWVWRSESGGFVGGDRR